MSAPRHHWVVVHAADGENPSCLECERCGRVEVIPFPIAVDEFLKISREFQNRHGECQEAHQ